MKYLGIDVHSKATVWCLLNEDGAVAQRGKVATTVQDLHELVTTLAVEDVLRVGQEVGTMAYFVHDTVTAAGVEILSFNAQHMRMIAASRKKTDRRDAFWLAKALQTGMTPHPVFIPTGELRLMRSLLVQRGVVARERRRWLIRAKSHLRACGRETTSSRSVARLTERALAHPEGLDTYVVNALELCERMESNAALEQKRLEKVIAETTKGNDAIGRLQTIPGVGQLTAVALYSWIGDAKRFPNARSLASYVGLVPSVSQSGTSTRLGGITKQGCGQLRSLLVQAAHTMMFRCRTEEAAPLQAIADRIHKSRVRRKIAVVAAARHILRIAYYVLRDGTVYDATKISSGLPEAEAPAA